MRWIEAGQLLSVARLAAGAGQSGRTRTEADLAAFRLFTVVPGPAHGGTDSGARSREGVPQAHITLTEQRAFLPRSWGISLTTARRADFDVPGLNRAEIANHAQASGARASLKQESEPRWRRGRTEP